MNDLKNIPNENYEYLHYTDYVFKQTVQKRANGLLKFLNIPYRIHNIILSEVASKGPALHRLDFAGEALKNNEIICLILECQSRLPTEEDIKRFFQYVSSLSVLKNKKIELYILCTEDAPYKTREYILNDDCSYSMKVISLKHINAKDIIENIEKKLSAKKEISDEDIAALQLIAYTAYDEPTVDILIRASNLVKEFKIDDNEKEVILYILDVLCTNMLDEEDKIQLLEETKMLNPRYEYQRNEGKIEGKIEVAKNMLKNGTSIEEITELTGLTKSQILNAK
ncbi:hypothetical protein [uncultured Methanobrevibacter sp.]|uniref:hypothetical protein n=1 Tax=uncultured Methanobrevibacter sp. TaxID=253161 RepID=UPI00261453B7|nr:hypothetical protein [uncultured Methanobrevibacter sp.]